MWNVRLSEIDLWGPRRLVHVVEMLSHVEIKLFLKPGGGTQVRGVYLFPPPTV